MFLYIGNETFFSASIKERGIILEFLKDEHMCIAFYFSSDSKEYFKKNLKSLNEFLFEEYHSIFGCVHSVSGEEVKITKLEYFPTDKYPYQDARFFTNEDNPHAVTVNIPIKYIISAAPIMKKNFT